MSKKRYRNRHPAAHQGSVWPWAAFLIICTGLVGLIIFISYQATPIANTASAGATHYMPPMSNRSIAFVAAGTLDTQKDRAQVSLEQGTLPPAGSVHKFTVISDENCTPDAQGISHCLNRLSYGSGEITVRHNHKIADIPCLAPGETLQLAS